MPEIYGPHLLKEHRAASARRRAFQSRPHSSRRHWGDGFLRAVDDLRDYAQLAWWEGSSIGLTGRGYSRLVQLAETDRFALKRDSL